PMRTSASPPCSGWRLSGWRESRMPLRSREDSLRRDGPPPPVIGSVLRGVGRRAATTREDHCGGTHDQQAGAQRHTRQLGAGAGEIRCVPGARVVRAGVPAVAAVVVAAGIGAVVRAGARVAALGVVLVVIALDLGAVRHDGEGAGEILGTL